MGFCRKKIILIFAIKVYEHYHYQGEQGLWCLAWKKIILIFLRLKIIMIIIFGIGIMGLCTGEDNSVLFRIKIFILLHLGDEELCCFGD